MFTAPLPRAGRVTIRGQIAGLAYNGQDVVESLRRDDLQGYIAEHLGTDDGILITDDTGFVKKGTTSAGVQRETPHGTRAPGDEPRLSMARRGSEGRRLAQAHPCLHRLNASCARPHRHGGGGVRKGEAASALWAGPLPLIGGERRVG